MEPTNTQINNPNTNLGEYYTPQTPEQFNNTPDRQELIRSSAENSPEQRQGVPQAQPMVVQQDQDNDSSVSQVQDKQDSTVNTIPETATDGDRIDQEWVNKVKEVISQTSEDPNAQQREISRLMAEYVLKRFGRQVGEAD